MKIHRPLAEASADLVRSVFEEHRVLDHLIAEAFRKNTRWGKRDRNFVASSVWEVVRWRRALAFIADSDDPRALLAAVWQRAGFEIPEWWKWQGAGRAGMKSRESDLIQQPRAIRESIPDWLDSLCEQELGGRWGGILSGLNQRAPVFLRANTLLANREDLLSLLAAEGVEAHPVDGLPDALRLSGTLPKRLLADGRFEIQDGGSQLVAPMLDIQPGMRVVDACAGAGGKTLHLAALMRNEGELIALDVSERKLSRLHQRAKAANVRNLQTMLSDPEWVKKNARSADRLLMDVPCSGLGTLRRQPDLKWRLNEAGLDRIKRTQRRLLDQYATLLSPGGLFVYATCSVLPSENEGQIEHLIQRDHRWVVEEQASVTPASTDFDGFHMSRCRRGGAAQLPNAPSATNQEI